MATDCREHPVRLPNGYGRMRDLELVHRWVVRTVGEDRFGTPWDPALQVLHSCDNPPCYRFDHLRLGTNTENHAEKRFKRRGRGPTRRFTAEQVIAIRERVAGGESIAGLAREHGVDWNTINHMVTDATYRDVGGPRTQAKENLNGQ